MRNKLQFFIDRNNFAKSKVLEIQKRSLQKIKEGKPSGIMQNIVLPVYIVF